MFSRMIAPLIIAIILMTPFAAKSQRSEKEAWLAHFSVPVGSVIGGGPGTGGLIQLLKFRDGWWINDTVNGPEYVPDHPDAIARRHPHVRVPRMFVTDLTSVPRAFWSLLPRDGMYARAAVIHDWLYWDQSYPREMADEIFMFAMRDDQLPTATRRTIFQAVRTGGQAAWNDNARRKQSGERRILAVLPKDPTATWAEWRQTPGVFGRVGVPSSPDAPPFGAQPPGR
jgi:hypothetical protein